PAPTVDGPRPHDRRRVLERFGERTIDGLSGWSEYQRVGGVCAHERKRVRREQRRDGGKKSGRPPLRLNLGALRIEQLGKRADRSVAYPRIGVFQRLLERGERFRQLGGNLGGSRAHVVVAVRCQRVQKK